MTMTIDPRHRAFPASHPRVGRRQGPPSGRLADVRDRLSHLPVALAAVASKMCALHVAQRVHSTLGERDDVVDARALRVWPSDGLVDGSVAQLAGPAIPSVDIDWCE